MAANPGEELGDIRIPYGERLSNVVNPKTTDSRPFRIDELRAKAEDILNKVMNRWLENNPGKTFRDFLQPLFDQLVQGTEINDVSMLEIYIITFINITQSPATVLETKLYLMQKIKSLIELSDDEYFGLVAAFEIEKDES